MLLLIALVSLSGCAEPVYRTQLEIYCPAIKQYSEDFNNKLADELESLPSDSRAIEEAMGNYIYLRDRIRQCSAEKEKIE